MVIRKESYMKLPPKEMRGKEKARERVEHGKKLVFKAQGNGNAAAESRHVRRMTGRRLDTA